MRLLYIINPLITMEAASMMGHQNAVQDQMFYSFHLEDHVPQTHLLRAIDRVLDLDGLHSQLAGHYSHTGRPSVPPELMIRMLIIGYCYGIRSERRLCCVLYQLPDRHGQGHYPGCGSNAGVSTSRGGIDPADDRAGRKAVCTDAPALDRGHRLWRGSHVGLVGGRERH